MSKASNSSPKKNKSNTLARFAGIGIQMGVIITAGALFGNYLDEKQQNEKPLWSISLSLLGVFIGLYLVIREALKIGEND